MRECFEIILCAVFTIVIALLQSGGWWMQSESAEVPTRLKTQGIIWKVSLPYQLPSAQLSLAKDNVAVDNLNENGIPQSSMTVEK